MPHTSFVLDASVAMSWAFEDEKDAYGMRIQDMLADCPARVPGFFIMEVANSVTVGERRKRIRREDADQFLILLAQFPIHPEPPSMQVIFSSVLHMARKHSLSVYDAAYLELARRERLPLATKDASLRKAAKKEKVKVI